MQDDFRRDREDGAALERLIKLMARLPGLGPRSARRAALHLVSRRDTLLGPLAEAMAEVNETVHPCPRCANLTTSPECAICTDPKRDGGVLCVVETVSDLWAMERVSVFKGRYQVLGGLLSALDGVGPEELGINKLADRVAAETINEIILALPATIDGQTTAHYIADALPDAKVTSLAQGVPVGGELDYLDEGTITAALNRRQQL